ncbi:MAG: bifunctional glutamate N-acetyltransferase/amino-acid acetyltransferase ArgJ [Candidatus Methylacidiphilales bacterium]
MSDVKWIKNGSVTSPIGFRAAGISAGIKKSGRKDMALVVSDCDADGVATFTTNQIKAAPVKVSIQHIKGGIVRAAIFNSGNANACTGLQGIADAKAMAEETARLLSIKPRQVLVCSTGRIGVPMPSDTVLRGIGKLVKKLAVDNGHNAAKAIMTTDTFPKEAAVTTTLLGKRIVIGAMAKGAGMIHPNMATMLACVTTDAAVEHSALHKALTESVDQTFNRISVDGDTSTNDTVLLMANGLAGNTPLTTAHPDFAKFRAALHDLLKKLARMIVEDGEKITRVVDLRICGAASTQDARRIAEAIARSALIKSSWYGGDPNWGRLMDVAGYAGARIREELVDIYYDGVQAVKGGVASTTPLAKVKRVAAKPSFTIKIDLHLGRGDYSLLVNDLTEAYVTFNKGE